jgi:hypothetical protein
MWIINLKRTGKIGSASTKQKDRKKIPAFGVKGLPRVLCSSSGIRVFIGVVLALALASSSGLVAGVWPCCWRCRYRWRWCCHWHWHWHWCWRWHWCCHLLSLLSGLRRPCGRPLPSSSGVGAVIHCPSPVVVVQLAVGGPIGGRSSVVTSPIHPASSCSWQWCGWGCRLCSRCRWERDPLSPCEQGLTAVMWVPSWRHFVVTI